MTLIVKIVMLVDYDDLMEELVRRTGMYRNGVEIEFESAILDTYCEEHAGYTMELFPIAQDELDEYEAVGLTECLVTRDFLIAWNNLLKDLKVESLFVQ